ncbi:MAG: glycosyltransferase family 4 protein [Chloroflexi bacterium]|nr:glycosyltransferase family 4 protein [Chloroflexota bacterium]
MRIAQVAPLFESVPPRLYGGTERVVASLTEKLVERGHEVTLFASGDSVSRAKLVSVWKRALRFDPDVVDPWVLLMAQIGAVYENADQFDIIHSHVDYFPFPTAHLVPTPTITTLHGRLDLPELNAIYSLYPDAPLVSISNSQRNPLPRANWIATVYNGIPIDQLTYRPRGGDYLAFLGRISPEKRPDVAIQIAKRAGMRLKIAAKVDKVDEEYFYQVIKPMLKDPSIEYIGEIDQKEKNEFLGNAYALLFPIDWPEPFGLAMAEAMATGTPVIASRRGSVPEIVEHGVTGFICDTVDEMVQACAKIGTLKRSDCRRCIEARFSVRTMTDRYENAYRRVLNSRQAKGSFLASR